MPGQCVTCRHPLRKEIETRILLGASYRSTAKEYRIGAQPLANHMNKHAKRDLTNALAKANETSGANLAGKVMDMHDAAVSILEAARAAKTLDAATGAIGQALRALELAGRFSGELAPAGGITVNLGVRIDQARAAVDVVREATSIAPREVVERALRVCRAWNAANPDAAVSL